MEKPEYNGDLKCPVQDCGSHAVALELDESVIANDKLFTCVVWCENGHVSCDGKLVFQFGE